jgi:hypothetical protein
MVTSFSSIESQVAGPDASQDRVRGVVNSVGGQSVQVSQTVDSALTDRRTVVVSQKGQVAVLDAAPATDRDPRIRPLGQGFRAPKRVAA